MKLSEAIILSIGMVTNYRSAWLLPGDNGPCGCAIGTALYSVFGEAAIHAGSGIDRCHAEWPWTRNKWHCHEEHSIAHEISHRHYKGESRESIAAWIATIEPAEVPVAVPAETEVSIKHEEPVAP